MRRIVEDFTAPSPRKKRMVEQSNQQDAQDRRERRAAAAAGIWPPPGMVTYRQCQAAITNRKGETDRCPEVALVRILAGHRNPFVVDPEDPAKGMCKKHGGRK